MCLYPTLGINRKYIATKKNGGIIPPLEDERMKYVSWGCQQCIECRKQKARGWQVRLLEDIKTNTNGKFITLTFSEKQLRNINIKISSNRRKYNRKYDTNEQPLENYERENEIATYATRHFLERWRKTYKKSLRHWLITELGHEGTERIHLHGIIWTEEPIEIIEQYWKYGWVWKGKKNTHNGTIENYVNEQTINYLIKYVHKMDETHPGYKSKILTTPGIGKNYINTYDSKNNKYNGIKTQEAYRTRTGHKINMPIYWRNKIYTEKEREKLWCLKLDKQERWVRGEKISIKEEENTYYKLVQWHRRINKELGYGDGTKDWKKTEYEQNRRNIKLITQIKVKEQEYITPKAQLERWVRVIKHKSKNKEGGWTKTATMNDILDAYS